MRRQQEEHGVERGGSEEESGAPLTETEERASERPPGVTPGATPEPDGPADRGQPRGRSCDRPEELSPDDFE